MRQRLVQAHQPLAGMGAHGLRRRVEIEQVADGRREAGEIEQAVVAGRHDVRAVVLPDPADQGAGAAIVGQDVGGGERHAAIP